MVLIEKIYSMYFDLKNMYFEEVNVLHQLLRIYFLPGKINLTKNITIEREKNAKKS